VLAFQELLLRLEQGGATTLCQQQLAGFLELARIGSGIPL